MPKVSDKYLETRRETILDAAVSCFAQNGFTETTIEDICKEAGVSHGAVYRYFKNKDGIIAASSQRDSQARAMRYETAKRQPTSRDAMMALLNAVRQMTQGESETGMKCRVQFFGESVRNASVREMQRAIREDNLRNMQEIIRDGQEKGEINPDIDTEALARFCSAIGDGLWVQKIFHPDLNVNKYVDAVIKVFERGFWADRPEEAKQH